MMKKKMKKFRVTLSRPEVDVICLALQNIAGGYPKTIKLRERLDALFTRKR
jgi:hypothetical protein